VSADPSAPPLHSAAPPAAGPVTAWFHCFAGIAGDMALGSLLDAGADFDEVVAMLQRLPFRGWDLQLEPVLRAGVAATRAVVAVTDDVVVRTHAHRRPPEQVHFHEVGSHDTIVDVVGTAAALEVLGVDVVTASAVATGTGTVRSAHGFIPNPSPAVIRLLRDVPTWGRDLPVELTTPTGAAILAALSSHFGPLPPMRIQSSGFGAGTKEIDGLPNCTQVVVGTALRLATTGGGQEVVLLEANLDDATGEVLAHALGALLDAGAHDAWITPILMKKGRPGHVLSALADPVLVDTLRHVLQQETGSLGVRAGTLQRWPASRRLETSDIEGFPVRVKVSPGRVKAEFDDAARVAGRTGLPLREVSRRAESPWHGNEPAQNPLAPPPADPAPA
jgi:pyridinium-3,5-bisthiocarboxylic acid mononucleotide nickel chelatase